MVNIVEGIVTYKATNNKFSGSFVTIDDIFYPNIGTFYLKNKDCSVNIMVGIFRILKIKFSSLIKIDL